MFSLNKLAGIDRCDPYEFTKYLITIISKYYTQQEDRQHEYPNKIIAI